MPRFYIRKILYFILLALLSSCVKYTPPPTIVHADNYSAVLNNEKRILPEYSHTFTVDDAIRIALANNPEYEKQKLAVELAYQDYYQSIVNFLPNVFVDANIGASQSFTQAPAFNSSWTKTNSVPAGLGVGTSFVIFNGLRKEFKLLQESAKILAQEELQKNMRRILVNSVIIAYYNIVQTIEQIKVTQADLKFQQDMRDFEMAKYEQNLITEESILNFEYLAEQDKSTILQLDLLYKQQTYMLASLLGLTSADLPKDIELMSLADIIETINIDFNPVGVEYYLDLAVDQRPDLKALREALRINKYEVYRRWAAFLPVITANADYGWGTDFAGGSNSSNSFGYGITTEWSLWDNAQNIFNLRTAQIDYDQSYQDLLIGWIAIIQEVRYSYDAMAMSLENYRVLEKAVDIAKRQVKMVQTLFETGMVTLPRLNEAQNNLYQSQFSLAIATIGIYQAKANLEKACGISRY